MNQLSVDQAFAIGLEHHQAGRLAEAEPVYRQILAVAPGHEEANHHLAIIGIQVGQLAPAVEILTGLIAQRPAWPAARSNLGNALLQLGRGGEAVAHLEAALTDEPGWTATRANLGLAYASCQRSADAADAFAEVLRQAPTHVEARFNLGVALGELGRLAEAREAFIEALKLQPGLALGEMNLGMACHTLGRDDEASAALRRALALQPDLSWASVHLAHVLANRGQLEEALEVCQAALGHDPRHAVLHNNQANLFSDLGLLDEAVASYRRALEHDPSLAVARSNMLLHLQYLPNSDPREILAAHHEWNQRYATGVPLQGKAPRTSAGEAGRRLRIGYLSPDLRNHSVGRLLLPLLENHDPQQVEVFAYACMPNEDEMSARLRQHVAVWRNITKLDDAAAAELIAADKIDILVDLAGHTAGHRLLVMARRPAPVQVTYLGYPDTTGLDAVDFRLTDSHADPPGMTEDLHSESLLRLDPCAWCCPPLADMPSTPRHAGPITFGCFNVASKVNEPLLHWWARILAEVPDSRLLLKAPGWGGLLARQRIERFFRAAGIAAERIELLGRVESFDAHLALHQRMDIALDTFPYHGTTMTLEALWMGIPVVTLAGNRHVSRVGVSLLTNLGHPELVAQTPEEYIAMAGALAMDLRRLASLRAGLRAEMRASPLMDGRGFARRVEAAYQSMAKRSL